MPYKKDKSSEKEELERVKEELAKTKKQAEEYLNGWKRAKADYINFKKDTEKQQKSIVEFAHAALILELLPILDHLKEAFKHVPKDQEDSNWIYGFKHIKKEFQDLLKSFDVEEIKTKGEKFNPEFHEAVGKEKKEGFDEDVIIREVKPGYKMQDKVIVPAKVVINSHK